MFGPTWARQVWAVVIAVIAGVGTFFVCALIPMWWYTDHVHGMMRPRTCTLWGLLNPEPIRPDGDGAAFREYGWGDGNVRTAVAVLVAMLAGAVIGGVRRSRRKEVRK